MRLNGPDGYIDFDLDLFWDVAEPLNAKIQAILAIDDSEIGLLYVETIEQLVGVALASAQVYIAAVSRYHGVPKDRVRKSDHRERRNRRIVNAQIGASGSGRSPS